MCNPLVGIENVIGFYILLEMFNIFKLIVFMIINKDMFNFIYINMICYLNRYGQLNTCP